MAIRKGHGDEHAEEEVLSGRSSKRVVESNGGAVAVAFVGLGGVNHAPWPLLTSSGLPVRWMRLDLAVISVWRGVNPDEVPPIALASQARPYTLVARGDTFIALFRRSAMQVEQDHVT